MDLYWSWSYDLCRVHLATSDQKSRCYMEQAHKPRALAGVREKELQGKTHFLPWYDENPLK